MTRFVDFKSLRFTQTIFALFIALTPLFIIGGIVAQRSFTTLEEEAIESQEQDARLAATEIAAFIQERQIQLELIVGVRRLSSMSTNEQQNTLNGLLAYDASYQELILLDANGNEIVKASRTEAFSAGELDNRSNDQAFAEPFETQEIYYSDVRFDEIVREPLVTMGVPIVDLFSGESIGILIAEFRFRPIWELIAQRQGNQTETDVYVTDSQGRLIAHSNPSLVLSGTAYNIPESSGLNTGLLGGDVVSATERLQLGNQQIVVIAERDYDDALSLANDLLQATFTVLIVTAIAVLLLATIGLNQFIRPLTRLTATAQAISEGNLNAQARVSGLTEIKTLAKSFNSMTHQLRDSISNLETRVQERTLDLQVAADVSTQITTYLDPDKLLNEVVQQLQTGFDFYHISIYTYNDESQLLQNAASITRDQPGIQSGTITLKLTDDGLVANASRTRQPQLAPVTSSDQQFMSVDHLPHTQSEMAVPIIVANKLIGVLDLQSDKPGRFGDDDLQVMPLLAKQIGIALQNAQSYEEAQNAKDVAEEANRVKSQFLANMSHELRTPLNAILNFTAFVADGVLGDVNDEQVKALNQSISSGKHLLALINDILDITKIEAGLMDLFVQEVEMGEIIGTAVSVGKGLAKDNNIALIDDVPNNLPNTFGDKRRLRQVFLNIISNAVKFTPEGSITITADCVDKLLTVTIADTGIGIASEDQTLVFESFKQAKHDLDGAIGTGLGMPISKYFVESHGGRIWLESQVNVGTTFYVELPILTEDEAREITHQTETLAAKSKA